MDRFQEFAKVILGQIPSVENLKLLAIKEWGEEIGGVNPSFVPSSGDEMIMYRPKTARSIIHSHDCVDIIKKGNLFFPNTYGLIIVKELINQKKILLHEPEKYFWFVGLDYIDNLFFSTSISHMVPYLQTNGIKYFHGSHPFKFSIDHDEIVVAFKKKLGR